jgi:hypothetical protein
MAQYLLLLYDNPANWTTLSPEEIQKAMAKYGAFREKLKDRKQWVAGQKLADEPGRVLRSNGEKIVATDGPYSETKEWLGGFFLIDVPNYNAAVEVSRECPHLEYGGTIEVREVDARVAAASAQALAS